jgi:hypothetical protein
LRRRFAHLTWEGIVVEHREDGADTGASARPEGNGNR